MSMTQKSNALPKEILNFLLSYHAFSLAVIHNDRPWSATCYYAFDPENIRFIFVSDMKTQHATAMQQNNCVSGTVSNDEKNIILIQGVQFTGNVYPAEGDYARRAKKLFLRKFPVAIFKKLTLWFIEPEYVKMTDNIHVFATKTHWKRNT
jgi:uncharacterized protein